MRWLVEADTSAAAGRRDHRMQSDPPVPPGRPPEVPDPDDPPPIEEPPAPLPIPHDPPPPLRT